MRNRWTKNERGTALLETAIILPLILLVCISIFEFGRAYQTWQVLTNAAREGARVAVLQDSTADQVKQAVKTYAQVGGVTVTDEEISIDSASPLGTWTGSTITVAHPFDFIVLNPIAKMVTQGSDLGGSLTMTAVAMMRNEAGS
jgi:Flp pilus assembly protein TadG